VQSLMDSMRKNHDAAMGRIDVEVALKE